MPKRVVPMSHVENLHAGTDALKMTPAAGYLGATVMGYPLNDLVAWATGVYIVMQIVLLIPKYVEWFRSWRLKRDSRPQGPEQS